MAAAPTHADRVMAYAIANVYLGAHAVGSSPATLAPGAQLDEQANLMRRQLQEPIIETLSGLGFEGPVSRAGMINSAVHAARGYSKPGRHWDRSMPTCVSYWCPSPPSTELQKVLIPGLASPQRREARENRPRRLTEESAMSATRQR